MASSKKTLGVSVSESLHRDYMIMRRIEKQYNETIIGNNLKQTMEEVIESLKSSMTDSQRKIFEEILNEKS